MERICIVLVCLGLLWGCSTAIDPFSENAGQVFAVHGFLTMAEPVQKLRVERLRESVLDDAGRMDGVVVRTLHEDTGQQMVWSISADQTDDAGGTIFEAAFTPRLGTYRLEVLDDDGRVSLTARTTLEGAPRHTYGEATVNGLDVSIPVKLLGVTVQPELVALGYTVRPLDGDELESIVISYGKAGQSAGPDWQFRAFLTVDHRTMLRRLDRNPNVDVLFLAGMTLRTRVPSSEFLQPAGVNIEGGHGFFGSVSQHDQSIRFTNQTLTNAGFVLEP